MRLRLLTYNIHKGIGGVDRRYKPERIVKTLIRYQPDIVMLQEVDDNVPRSSHHRQVDEIGDAIGMKHRAYQRNVTLKQGHYGNAILSRFPLDDIEDINLTIPLKKRRRALVARCYVRGRHQRTILLINLHLGLAGFERTIQLHTILDHLVMKPVHHDTPVIVGGDYNDVWGNLGKKCMEPAGFLPVSKNIRTFPAVMPVRQLDHIFYRGDMEFLHAYAGRSNLAREASDHLPLVADFRLANV